MSRSTNKTQSTGLITHTLELIRRSMGRTRWVVLIMLANYLICAVLFSILEGKALNDGAWWAVVTQFTVGYGDLSPAYTSGRAVGVWLMVSSFVLSLVLAAHITAIIIEDKHLFSHEEQERYEAALLAICQNLDLVPNDQSELPDVEWWESNTKFRVRD